MSLIVYKYAIPAHLTESGINFENEFKLSIPNPGIIMSVGVQKSRSLQFQVWALVDPQALPIDRNFLWLGTGHETDHTKLQFIYAYITDGLVFHLFEIGAQKQQVMRRVVTTAIDVGKSLSVLHSVRRKRRDRIGLQIERPNLPAVRLPVAGRVNDQNTVTLRVVGDR